MIVTKSLIKLNSSLLRWRAFFPVTFAVAFFV